MLVLIGTLVLVGAVSVSGTVLGWVRPSAPPPPAPIVSETEFTGVAMVVATDYLSWDGNDKPARQVALARVTAPKVTVDGWDGTGRQWAESPAVLGIARTGLDRAVVTVRLRVTPFAPVNGTPPAVPPAAAPDAGPNIASAPNLGIAGWQAQPARWLNLAVPLAKMGSRVVLTAPPALIGSAQASADGRAAPGSATGDGAFAQATRETVTTLLRNYGTGDLEFVRASGTSYSGLDKAAALEAMTTWRVRNVPEGDDGSTRVGDATVTWTLSGGAGKVKCAYRVELTRQNDRWYLASISAETEEVI